MAQQQPPRPHTPQTLSEQGDAENSVYNDLLRMVLRQDSDWEDTDADWLPAAFREQVRGTAQALLLYCSLRGIRRAP